MPRKIDPNVERTEWTSHELITAKISPPEWIVPNYLPIGLTVLAGRPFAGKSWFAFQIAQAIDQGGMLFGERARKGNVLYIAKEDANWSFRDRALKQHWVGSDTLKIFTGWERFKKGGMEHLRKVLREGNYVVCILDSLYKFLSGAKNERDGEMEPVMSELQEMYKKNWVDAILPLVHTNKGSVVQGDGGENNVMGDTSLMAVADNYLMFYHKQGVNHRTFLHAQGRMMPALDCEVKFDPVTFAWQLTTKQDKVKDTSIKALLIRTLDEQKRPCTPTLLSELTGKPVTLVSRELDKLAFDDLIVKLPKQGVHVPYVSKKHVSLRNLL